MDGQTTQSVLEEGRVAAGEWHQRSVDLSAFAGRKVSLELAADGGAAGEVALWGAPTITTPSHSLAPNIILYVIDGAGADWMSLYGYDRETTPNLEALASEGVVFERAYSNATWTKLSNPSFLTSLYPTALGYFRSLSDRVPEGVDTLADHFRRAGYLASFITSNPVGSVSSNLQEGPDATTTVVPEFECVSSAVLQEEFWAWRDAHPDSPYLAHIQTTDVHEPFKSQPPFAGLFLDEVAREEYFRWDDEIEEFGGWSELEAYPKIGTTKERYAAAQQALYDECMVHQDTQITRVDRGSKGTRRMAEHAPRGDGRSRLSGRQSPADGADGAWRTLLPHLRHPHPDAGRLAREDSWRRTLVGAGVVDRSVADPARARRPLTGDHRCRDARLPRRSLLVQSPSHGRFSSICRGRTSTPGR